MANGLLLGTIANVKDKTLRNRSRQLFVHNLYNEPTDRQTAEIDLLQPRRSHLQTKQLPQTPHPPWRARRKSKWVSVGMIFVFLISILCLGFDQPSVR